MSSTDITSNPSSTAWSGGTVINPATFSAAVVVNSTLNVTGLSTLAAVSATTGTFSGVVRSPAGTAPLPGVAVGGTTNGLYAPTATSLGLAANGVSWGSFNGTFMNVTAETDFASGTENAPLFFINAVGLYNSGSLLGFVYNHHKLMTIQSPGFLQVWSGDANNFGGTMQTGVYQFGSTIDGNQHGTFAWLNSGGNGVLQVTAGIDTPGTSTASKLPLAHALGVDVSGGTATIPKWSSLYVYSSSAGTTTRTLPTPANSYVGQACYLVQEGGNVLTLSAPAGVTVTMKTGSSIATGLDTLTTKTASTFVSPGASGDSTSALLVCTATDASTVATWRQLGGVGDWT